METILGVLLTPWVFITLVTVSVIIQMIAIETESFGWNTFILILMVLLLHAKFDLLNYVATNPVSTIVWIIGYFAWGLCWSFLKWYAKLSSIARNIKEAKTQTLAAYNYESIEKIPKDYEAKFYSTFKDKLESEGIKLYRTAGNSKEQFQDHIKDAFPELHYNKGKIVAWIIYWPFSMIATAINDPIKRFANYLYQKFSGVFETISDNIKNKILKDI